MASGAETEEWEERIDRMEEKFDRLMVTFKDAEVLLKELAVDNKVVKRKITELSKKLDKTDARGRDNEIKLQEMQGEISNLKSKLNDAVNHQRRKNIRIKNFPEAIKNKDLAPALREWIEESGFKISDLDIERVHRAMGPSKTNRARDIIIAFSREWTRDELLRHLRSIVDLSYKDQKILVFPDLTDQTRKERGALRPVVEALISANIKFTWAFPTAILIFRNEKRLIISNMAEGKQVLKQLGLEKEASSIGGDASKDMAMEQRRRDGGGGEEEDQPGEDLQMEEEEREEESVGKRTAEARRKIGEKDKGKELKEKPPSKSKAPRSSSR